jgi:hypothetical protein
VRQAQFSRESLSSGCHQVHFRPFPTGPHEIPSPSQKLAIYVDLRTFTLTVPRDTRTSHNPKVAGSNPAPATIGCRFFGRLLQTHKPLTSTFGSAACRL